MMKCPWMKILPCSQGKKLVASFVLLLIGAVRATAATETVYVASD
jgi:hypothetical protein